MWRWLPDECVAWTCLHSSASQDEGKTRWLVKMDSITAEKATALFVVLDIIYTENQATAQHS